MRKTLVLDHTVHPLAIYNLVGSDLIPLILGAQANLGSHDARYSGTTGEDWLEIPMSDFLVAAQQFSLAFPRDDTNDKVTSCFLLTKKCKGALRESWNADLPHSVTLTDNLKRLAACTKDDNNNKEDKKDYKRPRLGEPGGVAKKRAKSRRGIYIAVTPPPTRLTEEEKVKCQNRACTSTFSSHHAAKTHHKKKHPHDQYVDPPKVVNPATGKTGVVKKRIDKVSLLPGLLFLP